MSCCAPGLPPRAASWWSTCASLNLNLAPYPRTIGVADFTALRAHLREQAATPFNTATGPLFTAQLVQLAPDDHVIFY